MKLTVLKFGSSVLRDEHDLPRAVQEIYRHWRDGAQVLVVVSALGATTDALLRRAALVSEQPAPATLAALLATGETAAAALLGLAVQQAGLPVLVLDAAQADLRTAGEGLDAELTAVNETYLRAELARNIVIVPGFVGRSAAGVTTLLGRGGSDLTALFLAARLGGKCLLIKDVAGLYTSDPATAPTPPVRYVRARYATAERIGGGVIQAKAVRFAARHGLRFGVTGLGATHITEIGPGPDWTEDAPAARRPPLRVAVLGCGIVGGGVYQRLAAWPDFFTVTGVAVRRAETALAAGVPARLITTDAARLIDGACDVVIETIGGTGDAGALVRHALQRGRHVVTANKALLATTGRALPDLAARQGVQLRYSAAVGGVLPALETLTRMAVMSNGVKSFAGVINGTCNFILDELAHGADFATAVRRAQENGYAEADPRLDLDGTDAAQKLALLWRAAFGVELDWASVPRTGLDATTTDLVRQAQTRGRVVRLIATGTRTPHGYAAEVKVTEIDAAHPLAAVRGAGNCLLVTRTDGTTQSIAATGAGRYPTATAILADVLDLHNLAATTELLEPVVERSAHLTEAAESVTEGVFTR